MKRLLLVLFLSTTAFLGAQEQPTGNNSTGLTRFDLDFPGGTPRELVQAIQKASGRPLNAVIPAEYSELRFPSLTMREVDAAQLFAAFGVAQISKYVQTSGGAFHHSYGLTFRTVDAKPTDTSVWTLTVGGSPFPPERKVTRFYLLSPYLEGGLSVDDVTTAVQTAWRMAGANPSPALSFHRETRLLIASGEQSSVELIDAVLSALRPKIPAQPTRETTKGDLPVEPKKP